MQWFAQVQGQIYGPYSDADMQGYVAEGRVNGQSLISNIPAEGFYPASSYDIFSFWAGTGQVKHTPTEAPAQPSYAAPQVESEPLELMTPQPTPITLQQASPAPATPLFRPQISAQPAFSSQSAQALAPESAQNVFMIMAEIRSEGVMDFLTQLQDFGTAERVGDSVWLLKSSASADALRNSLSQALSRQDRMFIVDCTQNRTAWFNIGADLDNRIRAIWED